MPPCQFCRSKVAKERKADLESIWLHIERLAAARELALGEITEPCAVLAQSPAWNPLADSTRRAIWASVLHLRDKFELDRVLSAVVEASRRLATPGRYQQAALDLAVSLNTWQDAAELARSADAIRDRYFGTHEGDGPRGYRLPTGYLKEVLQAVAGASFGVDGAGFFLAVDRFLDRELGAAERTLLWLITPASPPGRGRPAEGPYLAFYLPDTVARLEPRYSANSPQRTRTHKKIARRRSAGYVRRLLESDCSAELKVEVLGLIADGLEPEEGSRLAAESSAALVEAADGAVDWLAGAPVLASSPTLESWRRLRKRAAAVLAAGTGDPR